MLQKKKKGVLSFFDCSKIFSKNIVHRREQKETKNVHRV